MISNQKNFKGYTEEHHNDPEVKEDFFKQDMKIAIDKEKKT